MIVIDANILVYGTLEAALPEQKAMARKVLSNDPKILLPTFWRYEYLNVLSNYVRAGKLDPQQAEDIWYATLMTTEAAEAPVDQIRALTLSASLGISAYDAQYVALAEGANTVLVTEDKRLRKAAGDRAVSMQEYLASR